MATRAKRWGITHNYAHPRTAILLRRPATHTHARTHARTHPYAVAWTVVNGSESNNARTEQLRWVQRNRKGLAQYTQGVTSNNLACGLTSNNPLPLAHPPQKRVSKNKKVVDTLLGWQEAYHCTGKVVMPCKFPPIVRGSVELFGVRNNILQLSEMKTTKDISE